MLSGEVVLQNLNLNSNRGACEVFRPSCRPPYQPALGGFQNESRPMWAFT